MILQNTTKIFYGLYRKICAPKLLNDFLQKDQARMLASHVKGHFLHWCFCQIPLLYYQYFSVPRLSVFIRNGFRRCLPSPWLSRPSALPLTPGVPEPVTEETPTCALGPFPSGHSWEPTPLSSLLCLPSPSFSSVSFFFFFLHRSL